MLLAMLADATVTHIGQPEGYWHNPPLVYEGNAISEILPCRCKAGMLTPLEQVIIGLVLYRLVASSYPVVGPLSFHLGLPSWALSARPTVFFYNCRLGWPTLVAWGCVLSSGIVFSIFTIARKANIGATGWSA